MSKINPYWVLDNLWQLSEEDLCDIASELDIKISKKTFKPIMIEKIKDSGKANYLNIYNKYKNVAFGICSYEACDLLDIDNKTLKKLAKKGFINVNYTKPKKLYGRYVNIPYYDLINILDLKKGTALEEALNSI